MPICVDLCLSASSAVRFLVVCRSGEVPVMRHVADRAHGAVLHLIAADAAGRKMFASNGHYFMGRAVPRLMHNFVNPGDRRHLSWTEDLQSLWLSLCSDALVHGGEVESLNFYWAQLPSEGTPSLAMDTRKSLDEVADVL